MFKLEEKRGGCDFECGKLKKIDNNERKQVNARKRREDKNKEVHSLKSRILSWKESTKQEKVVRYLKRGKSGKKS